MDPYRLFFPLGVVYAVIGVAIWALAAVGWMAYPSVLHQMLMIQGFEQCFVAGFLLTALPGLTHSYRATRPEVGTALTAVVLFGACTLAGWTVAAHACYLTVLGGLAFAGIRRVRSAKQLPAEELVFVALGLSFGIIGATLLAVRSAGVELPIPPRFAERLLSLGTVLSLVLGVGALLVPVFIGMRDPLAIPGLAGAHERKPRRILYAGIAMLLVASFALDLFSQNRWGALCRAAAATLIMLMVWKLYRLPGRRDLPAFGMWFSGWFVLAGLWTAFAIPRLMVAALHMVFIGGFGMLTLAIGTRVVIAHGRHGLPAEVKVFTPIVAITIVAALATRVAADLVPASALALYGLSAIMWIIGWLAWGVRAIPRIIRVSPAMPLVMPQAPKTRS